MWVTTSDGHIRPAPSEHLWWGNGYGDRPSETATVINVLLDDLGTVPDLREH
ncbi:hypothetical protein AB0D60_29245 [Streptomyces sp. NPDC048306]|uniref:hypothetical protein n=1 Tax=Streptomyces sp. NPDC048306 TaxID=3154502 RepID=UPI0034072F9D